MEVLVAGSLFLVLGIQAVPLPETTTPDGRQQINIFEKCMPDLGCFQTGPPFFHPVYRPISLLPWSNVTTKFWLYGPTNPTLRQELEPNLHSLNKSAFDPNLETKFIIHGFRSSLTEGDYKHRMRDALLSYGQYNVIIVDWTKSNGNPYPQAVANARVVGAKIANLIHFLVNRANIRPESVHLIGHSLGAQLSGWAGERVQNLGRISGLDPAGPYFHFAENVVRLDSSDALFVDVIHTDGGTGFIDGLGILEPIGHLDFYPNGGSSQPGCGSSNNSNTAFLPEQVNNDNVEHLGGSNSCDHSRAPELYIASIPDGKERCPFESVSCEQWTLFKDGKCSGDSRNPKGLLPLIAQMGFHSHRIQRAIPGTKFYLQTTSSAPYCVPTQRV